MGGIYRVPAPMIAELWPLIGPHVERGAAEHPFLSADDVRTMLLLGRGQMFAVTNEGRIAGVVVMELLDFPSRSVANVVLLAGERHFLRDHLEAVAETVQTWARHHGADTFAVHGRPGWIRLLRRFGGEPAVYALVTKELGDGRRRRDATNG